MKICKRARANRGKKVVQKRDLRGKDRKIATALKRRSKKRRHTGKGMPSCGIVSKKVRL